jgi:DNA-binding MarR family transcriptional regulator
LSTEAGREKIAQMWKEAASGRISSDLKVLSEKFRFFKFFEGKV